MKVFVIMGNDFPEAVFSNEREASKFCEEKRKEPSNLYQGDVTRMRIHWRIYPFDLIARQPRR